MAPLLLNYPRTKIRPITIFVDDLSSVDYIAEGYSNSNNNNNNHKNNLIWVYGTNINRFFAVLAIRGGWTC